MMTNKRVLMVDDDESVRWVLTKSLENEGIETELAKNAGEALERIKAGDLPLCLWTSAWQA